MEIINTNLEEVKIMIPQYYEDERGYYTESFSIRNFKEAFGFDFELKQEGHSYSKFKDTIRGIHFQNMPTCQAKLVRCIRGSIIDYAIDLRKESKTYKKWISVELTADNRKQLFIPHGFGHLFVTLCDDCEIMYKVDNLYSPEHDRNISYLDDEIGLELNISTPILSKKDQNAPYLKDSDCNF